MEENKNIFGGMLKFLDEKANTDYRQGDEFLKIQGQIAYNSAKMLGEIIAGKEKDFVFVGSSSWQNSGHIAKYFWLQFKREKHKQIPYSISVTTIKKRGKYIFKVYVEVSDMEIQGNMNKITLEFNQAILKIEQPQVDFYYEGQDLENRKKYTHIESSKQAVLNAMQSGRFGKITTNIDIDANAEDGDDEILEKIIKAFNILIPHYDAIFGEKNERNKWILPCDISKYNIIEKFKQCKNVYWHYTFQTQNIKAGDIVYLYVGKPYSRIMYECKVVKTNIIEQIHDEFKYDDEGIKSKSHFQIQLVRKLNSLNLSIVDLHNNGVSGNIQSARKIDKQTENWICNNKSQNDNNDLICNEENQAVESLSEKELESILNEKDDNAGYVLKSGIIKTRKINRNIIDNLKKKYNGQCQLCGVNVGEKYSKDITEAHHIEFFSKTQNNDSSNIIILCPNCHALIHACEPIYNKEEYSFDFEDGEKIKIKVVGHLKN